MPLFGLLPPNVEKLFAKHDVKGLVEALDYKDPQIRRSAAYNLGELGDTRAVESLISSLNDDESNVRKAAIAALAKLKDTRALQPLLLLLTDSDHWIRIEAAEGLGMLGDKRAVEPLQMALKDKMNIVSGAVARALRVLIPVDEANKLIEEAQQARGGNELKAVRRYLSYLAVNWWATQPETRATAVCDACGNRDIRRDDGYLIGSSLWCTNCYYDKGVEAQIEQDPDRSLGRGVFQKAQEMFGGDDNS